MMRGEGNKGMNRGVFGDFVLHIKVNPHKFFKRSGLDIFCIAPLSFVQATLGSKIFIDTVNGEKIKIAIPAGTQNGEIFRLKGKGLNSNSRHKGDLLVRILVRIPRDLSSKQKNKIKELDDTLGTTDNNLIPVGE